ncbi:MAG: hypothetical protein Q7S09_01555, partial [bacterium]|nr:hypothetical protein [bacterium]
MKKIIYSALSFGSIFPLSALAVEETTAPSASGIASIADFYDIIQVAARWLVVFGIIIGAVFI